MLASWLIAAMRTSSLKRRLTDAEELLDRQQRAIDELTSRIRDARRDAQATPPAAAAPVAAPGAAREHVAPREDATPREHVAPREGATPHEHVASPEDAMP